MHREDTATLTTYLSDNMMIFTCLIPLDDKPIVKFNRVHDPFPPIQNNFSCDQQNQANYLNKKPNIAQQPRYNSLYSAAAKRYFATITLSPDEIDSFRAFLPVIDNFYHLQLYVKNKQRAQEHRNQFNYGYEQNKPEAYAVPQRAANPTLEAMGGQKSSSFILKKTPPERELSLNEMPNELRLYVLVHPEVEKVLNQPSFEENDSSTVCYKLELKSHIKGFKFFEYWYMKQLASE